MKQSLIAAFLFASVTSGSALAQEAAHNPLIAWQGAATIVALTGAPCANTGFVVGDLLDSIYRPNLDPAEPTTGLTMISRRAAVSFFRTSGNIFMNGTGNYSGAFISGRATQRPNSTNGPVTGAYNLKITPATFTAATVSNVDVSGTFTNFFGNVGCTVKISASYQRRP